MKVTDWIVVQFSDLAKRRFYGKLIIEMKNGELALIRLEETKIPPKNLE